jgi:hypothetical protein
VTQAIRHVHETLIFNEKRCVVPEATIRDYYYDPDPEWRRAFKAELAWRALPVTKQVPGPGAGAAPCDAWSCAWCATTSATTQRCSCRSRPVDLTEPSWAATQKRSLDF